ncbi:HPr family phosphocarrier protein [Kitasatospora indigofera]|uniref:HPr family phosphocarrier protein n=1 Tax=Kitasatospora indigofera TaxID=67307 RepID=UPI0033B1EAC5
MHGSSGAAPAAPHVPPPPATPGAPRHPGSPPGGTPRPRPGSGRPADDRRDDRPAPREPARPAGILAVTGLGATRGTQVTVRAGDEDAAAAVAALARVLTDPE